MRRFSPTLVVVAALLAACAATQISASPARTMPDAGPSGTPSPSPTAAGMRSPQATPSSSPLLELPGPGRPYDAAAVLDAMVNSRRPDGVPDQLERPAIAGAVADQLWTADGRPWSTIAVGGSCGPEVCSLEVAGSPEGGVGEDLYVFAIRPDGPEVEVLTTTLGGLSPELVTALDAAVRSTWSGDLGGMVLTSARWSPPPDDGVFALSYRSGGEEGSPGVDLLLDARRGTVTAP
ncbi:MAG: hypothetical protein ACR2K4_01300 [Candidatus Limnocylindria bacterium]